MLLVIFLSGKTEPTAKARGKSVFVGVQSLTFIVKFLTIRTRPRIRVGKAFSDRRSQKTALLPFYPNDVDVYRGNDHTRKAFDVVFDRFL